MTNTQLEVLKQNNIEVITEREMNKLVYKWTCDQETPEAKFISKNTIDIIKPQYTVYGCEGGECWIEDFSNFENAVKYLVENF